MGIAGNMEVKIMPFGKYKDKPLEDIPRSYWRWMYDNKKLSGDLLKYAVNNVPDIKLMEEKKNNPTS